MVLVECFVDVSSSFRFYKIEGCNLWCKGKLSIRRGLCRGIFYLKCLKELLLYVVSNEFKFKVVGMV